jgi:hypothetical protein
MRSCPKCSSVVFTGATDCATCGYVFTHGEVKIPVRQAVAPEPSPVLGTPLYREQRPTPRIVSVILVVVAVAAIWRGLAVASSGGVVSCTGKESFFCTAALAIGQAIFGLSGAHIFYGAFLVSVGLVFLSIAWDLS